MASGPSSGLTIVLLGNSGVGKSASKEVFTKEVFKETDSVFSKRITVVDTPGILESEKEVTNLCQDLLKSKEPCFFLVVIKIDRFTEEQNNAVAAAIKVIGDEESENSCLLLTSGDALNDMKVDESINGDPENPLRKLVARFKGRYEVFNNENGGLEQVRHLLEKSGHLSNMSHLPDEMVAANNVTSSERSTRVQMASEGGSKTDSETTTFGGWREWIEWLVELIVKLIKAYRTKKLIHERRTRV